MKVKTTFRKGIAICLSLSLLLIPLDSYPTMNNRFCLTANAYSNTGNQIEDLIGVASEEIGFKGVNDHRNKYTIWCGQLDPNEYPDNGYGYEWCQAFVGYCAHNAGISTDIIPRNPGTYTCKSFFSKQGLWHNSQYHGGSYSPQRGDIVYFQWDGYSGAPSHVGIVTGATDSKLYTIEGNTGADEVRAKEYNIGSYVIQGYCSPNYTTLYNNAPSYSTLSANCTSIAINEEITFYASSDCAQGYTIGIDNSSGRYITQEMPGGQLTLKFTEPGNYGAYVTSYNPKGYCDSSWISFTVYDSKPNSSRLSADKTAISIGDTITFSASSDDPVKGFTIGIDNSEGRYITQEMPDGVLTLTFDKVGKYGAYVTSYNNYGYSDSEWITFDVYDTKPSSSFLLADKKIAYVGQEITFNATSDIATGYMIGVDNESGRLITQEMPNGTLKLSFDHPGEYSAYVTSYNNIGYADSERVFFTVYNTPPTFSTLSSNLDKLLVNETITFTAESDLANEFCIGIDYNGERLITENMPDGKFTHTFTKPGKYYAYVTSSNGYGYVDSKWITFTVYTTEEDMIYNGDCNNDGEFNVSDVVLLQKWLLAVPDTDIEDWKAADLCKDDKLNVFDLCLMKRKLLYES